MATTHGLTVWAHSCIKPPRNPKTGLSSTLHERAKTYHGYVTQISDEYENLNNNYNEDDDEIGRPNHVYTNPAFDTISQELQNLSDTEFYEKLLQLKNEQKKTLQRCEKLYKKKVLGDDDIDTNGVTVDYVPNSGIVHLNGSIDIQPDREELVNGLVEHDLQNTTSKPPSGRSHFQTSTTIKSPGCKTVPIPRPSSAPVFRRRGSLSRSLEEEVWAKLASERNIQRESIESNTELDTERLLENKDSYDTERLLESKDFKGRPELSAAMSRIEDMWEQFSVQDYSPPKREIERPSSASVTRKEKKEKEWRHRITIPKPFKMTLRESAKEKTKTKAQIEHEKKLLQKQREEEIECQKKFKAQPVPAHVYLPLYDEINEKNEARKRYIHHYSQELLKSQEKPFNFMTREEEKKKEHVRTYSAPVKNNSNTFKANPVPGYLYDTSIDDQIREEEEYRKIRIKLRAAEIYRKSSLPRNMEARQKVKEMQKKEKSIQNKRKKSKNKVSHEVPDYEELYRHFQKELLRRKQEREGTVVKPFKLSTAPTKSEKEKILEDMKRDEETLKENRWPYMTPRATPRKSLGYLANSLDSLPSNSTKANDLRTTKTKQKDITLKENERRELEQYRKQRINEMRLRRSIQERTGTDSAPTLEEIRLQKLRNCREAERERIEQYENELAEMKERVGNRPLLVERQSQINAKNMINKKFSTTLKNVGLDDDFVQSRSSRAASIRDDTGEDYDDDFDATYSKTKDESLEEKV